MLDKRTALADDGGVVKSAVMLVNAYELIVRSLESSGHTEMVRGLGTLSDWVDDLREAIDSSESR